jgi:phosphate-selective porin OprO/OprP
MQPAAQGSPDTLYPTRLPQPEPVPPSEFEAVLKRIEALENRVEERSAPQIAAEKKKPDDGCLDLSSKKWNVKLGGHVQMDYILWPYAEDPIPAENYFEFRRLRLMADGQGYGVYDFRLQMDFEPESGENVAVPVVDVKDAYLTANEVTWLQRVRIGNFFVPFGLEQVTNDTNNIFLERSIPTQNIFTADREVGVATYGASNSLDTTWTFGVFFDRISESLKERIDDRQGTRVSGRLTHLLYYDEASQGRYLLHTGAGGLYTHNYNHETRFRARPQIHEGPFLIDSGILPAQGQMTGNIELATVWGPFSLQSEGYLCDVNLETGDRVLLSGYYAYASYFLTGENRVYERYGQHGAQFGRTVPYHNFFLVPGCTGWGAWELKARTSYLDLAEINRGQYQDITVGLNWYWTDRIRVMLDWIHPWTTAETVYGTTQSDVLGMRLDFNW